MSNRHLRVGAIAAVICLQLSSIGAKPALADDTAKIAQLVHQLEAGSSADSWSAYREITRLVKENPARPELVWPLLRLATKYDRGDKACSFQILRRMAGLSPDQFSGVIPDIAKIAHGKDKEEQWEAIGLLGAIGQVPRSVIDQLSGLGRSSDRYDPLLAVRALGAVVQLDRSDEHFDQLVHYLDDRDSNVRAAVAYALGPVTGRKADQQAVDTLLKLMTGESPKVRVMAAIGYQQCGGKGEAIVPVLLAALKEPDEEVRLRKTSHNMAAVTHRFHAIVGLVQVAAKTPEVLAELKAASKDEHPWVRQAAEHALRRLEP